MFKLIGKVVKSQKGLIQYTKKGTPFLLVAPLMVRADKRGKFAITLDNGTTIDSSEFDPAKHSLFAVPVYGDIVDAFKEECDDDMKLEVGKPYTFLVEQRLSAMRADGSRTKWTTPIHPNFAAEQLEMCGETFDSLPHLPLLATMVEESGLATPADQALNAALAAQARNQAMAMATANTATSAVAEPTPAK